MIRPSTALVDRQREIECSKKKRNGVVGWSIRCPFCHAVTLSSEKHQATLKIWCNFWPNQVESVDHLPPTRTSKTAAALLLLYITTCLTPPPSATAVAHRCKLLHLSTKKKLNSAAHHRPCDTRQQHGRPHAFRQLPQRFEVPAFAGQHHRLLRDHTARDHVQGLTSKKKEKIRDGGSGMRCVERGGGAIGACKGTKSPHTPLWNTISIHCSGKPHQKNTGRSILAHLHTESTQDCHSSWFDA